MKLIKFVLNFFDKIFDKKKKIEEKQTCKCCISDIENRLIEVSDDKKTSNSEKNVMKPKTVKKKTETSGNKKPVKNPSKNSHKKEI